ncbi:hypothetical protein NM208_g13222 [Fusarium decemcellulare]|uniref:Uncharacterized protein n=1 Tax=Fusarium decemcellulare TaxID=57161 RepID=A0ACC1RN58_9HYPO|nr:hypothetical protein NM208_g13222 [Fusarium decemcellulare]
MPIRRKALDPPRRHEGNPQFPDSAQVARQEWAPIKLFTKEDQIFDKYHGRMKGGSKTNITYGSTNDVNGETRWRNGTTTAEHVVLSFTPKEPFSLDGGIVSWIIDHEGRLDDVFWGPSTGLEGVQIRSSFTSAQFLRRWIEEDFLEAMDQDGRTLDGGSFGLGERV